MYIIGFIFMVIIFNFFISTFIQIYQIKFVFNLSILFINLHYLYNTYNMYMYIENKYDISNKEVIVNIFKMKKWNINILPFITDDYILDKNVYDKLVDFYKQGKYNKIPKDKINKFNKENIQDSINKVEEIMEKRNFKL